MRRIDGFGARRLTVLAAPRPNVYGAAPFAGRGVIL